MKCIKHEVLGDATNRGDVRITITIFNAISQKDYAIVYYGRRTLSGERKFVWTLEPDHLLCPEMDAQLNEWHELIINGKYRPTNGND